MTNYTTPGVYVEEISTLPPSVAQVATAVPAFIGYTEKGPIKSPTRLSSMLDFESLFGGPQTEEFSVSVETDPVSGLSTLKELTRTTASNFTLYHSMKLFFSNGGGSCYVASVGHYADVLTPAAEKGSFSDCLMNISKVDEPTIIVVSDMLKLSTNNYHTLCQEAIDQCAKLKDRFTIIDLADDDLDGSAFRNRALNNLSYGAAYTPHLRTSMTYAYDESLVTVNITLTDADPDADATSSMLADLENDETAIYNKVKARLANQYITLPPSAAIAGIYARVDGSRGVWKAPANVGVSGVIGPSRIISHDEQGRLNIDPTSGKSINVIRNFTGKGTLVWGARTLAGNDNEWRYINVRRLFINIEESSLKATAFAVFEPNDATTWLKVKAMIDNYLYGLWQQGALAGPTPESSYYVNVGLGKTMTAEDILNGYMVVEIGIAAVRPAEFIVLKFSHKLQEA